MISRLTKILILCSVLISPCYAENPKFKDAIRGFNFAIPISDSKHVVIEGKVAFNIASDEIKAKNVFVRYFDSGVISSTLKADYVIFNKKTKQLRAYGNVKITTPIQLFSSFDKSDD